MEKMVLVVMGKEMSVTLSEYQLKRIRSGCSSTLPNEHIVATGVAYCFLKEVEDKGGDVYFQYEEPEGGYDIPGNAPKYEPPRQRFIGPAKRLNLSQMRTVILKQPTYIRDKPFAYFHVLYDQTMVCFVSENGYCLLVNRADLALPSAQPPTSPPYLQPATKKRYQE